MKMAKHINIRGATERNFTLAYREIDRIVSLLGLPKEVRGEASFLYRRALEEHLIEDLLIEGVAPATLYIVCRKLGIPRALGEIAKISQVGEKEIRRFHRILVRGLDIHLPPIDPISYAVKFGRKLNISKEAESKAIELLEEAKKKHLTSGCNPRGSAAGAIYLACWLCGEHRIQEDVADVAYVTEVTVRNRYRELVEEIDLDVELP